MSAERRESPAQRRLASACSPKSKARFSFRVTPRDRRVCDHHGQGIVPLRFLTGCGEKSILDVRIYTQRQGSLEFMAVGKLWEEEVRADPCGTSLGAPEPAK